MAEDRNYECQQAEDLMAHYVCEKLASRKIRRVSLFAHWAWDKSSVIREAREKEAFG
jgi:hypothetical protein